LPDTSFTPSSDAQTDAIPTLVVDQDPKPELAPIQSVLPAEADKTAQLSSGSPLSFPHSAATGPNITFYNRKQGII